MQSILLIGPDSKISEYIDQYIINNSIKSYNTVRFYERIKIADARSIQKILAVKLSVSEKRLIILSSDITLDAQHALLKTLEELPESTDIIIKSTDNYSLLPTIVSRCKVIRFKNQEVRTKDQEADNKKISDLLLSYLSKESTSVSDVLLLSQEILKEVDSKQIVKKLVLTLRDILLESMYSEIKNKNKSLIHNSYFLLHNLNTLYPLIEHNNLNVRLVLENALLNNLFSI